MEGIQGTGYTDWAWKHRIPHLVHPCILFTLEAEKDALTYLREGPGMHSNWNEQVLGCIRSEPTCILSHLCGGHQLFWVDLSHYKFCPECILLKQHLNFIKQEWKHIRHKAFTTVIVLGTSTMLFQESQYPLELQCEGPGTSLWKPWKGYSV